MGGATVPGPGVGDSVPVWCRVDTVLVDARPSAVRRACPPGAIAFAWPHGIPSLPLPRWILLYSATATSHALNQAPIPLPASFQDTDRLLDELADSLSTSANPNFGAVARYLFQRRERLASDRSHGFKSIREVRE